MWLLSHFTICEQLWRLKYTFHLVEFAFSCGPHLWKYVEILNVDSVASCLWCCLLSAVMFHSDVLLTGSSRNKDSLRLQLQALMRSLSFVSFEAPLGDGAGIPLFPRTFYQTHTLAIPAIYYYHL